jgi:uncharacterized protein YhaN
MFNPLDLFKSVKSAAITVGVIAALTFTGTLWVQKHLAEKEVVKLEVAKKALEQDLFKEQVKVHGLNVVVETLQDTFTTIAENIRKESALEKEITDAPAEDDAPMAPVLRRTLRGLDGMLHRN